MGLICTGPLICGLFKKYILQYYTIFSWLNSQIQNYRYGGLTVKLYIDFQLCGGSVPLTPTLFEGQLYINIKSFWGFPGGAVVENLPASAGDTGSSPGLGRSHMPRSNWAREPQILSLRIWSLCSTTREAATVRGPHTTMKSGPRLPQLGKALTQKCRPNTAKNK